MEEMKLVPYGSTKKCKACGGKSFTRRYAPKMEELIPFPHFWSPPMWKDIYPERIHATCNKCGWQINEKLKG